MNMLGTGAATDDDPAPPLPHGLHLDCRDTHAAARGQAQVRPAQSRVQLYQAHNEPGFVQYGF